MTLSRLWYQVYNIQTLQVPERPRSALHIITGVWISCCSCLAMHFQNTVSLAVIGQIPTIRFSPSLLCDYQCSSCSHLHRCEQINKLTAVILKASSWVAETRSSSSKRRPAAGGNAEGENRFLHRRPTWDRQSPRLTSRPQPNSSLCKNTEDQTIQNPMRKNGFKRFFC